MKKMLSNTLLAIVAGLSPANAYPQGGDHGTGYYGEGHGHSGYPSGTGYAVSTGTAPAASSTAYAHNGPSESPGNANNLTLISALEDAPTMVDRILLLPTGPDWKYDFNNPPNNDTITKGNGGHTVKADRKAFPALIGTGVSMTVGFIGPCGFNTPHTHPRSSEINIVVEGRLVTNFIAENGAPLIENTLGQYQMTVFPQGAVHTEFNPDCEPSVFVAGFASEDPGVQQVAQTLFGLQEDIIKADLGIDTINGADVEAFKASLPKNVASGVESCLKKCGIPKRM